MATLTYCAGWLAGEQVIFLTRHSQHLGKSSSLDIGKQLCVPVFHLGVL